MPIMLLASLPILLGSSVPMTETQASAPVAAIAITEARLRTLPTALRSPLKNDPVEREMLSGALSPETTRDWTVIRANADGWFQGREFSSAVVLATVDLPEDRTLFLEAQGSTLSYVNGEPRAGDVYQYGYVSLPVRLRKGTNQLVFVCQRGRLKIDLKPVERPLSLDPRDPTLPDLTPRLKGPQWGALVVRNATGEWIRDLRISAAGEGARSVSTPVGVIPPFGTRKVGFQFHGGKTGNKVRLRLLSGGKALDETWIELRRRTVDQPYKQTFVSEIDGSVQYFAVNPSASSAPNQALFLSTHGASVEASGQAEAYAAKTWGHLVAPTNRRPFGFNWEDIGRLDALEVLAIAQRDLKTDPRRTYLTGHSMGGHGSWHLGVHFPGRFGAIAPSAGWISYWTYAGGRQYDLGDPAQAMLRRASNPSDTLALKDNYRDQAIFILHGDADETVPVGEARTMRKELEGTGAHVQYHEQPGAGHWWDEGDEPGAACVDYPGIFDLFSRRRIPLDGESRHARGVTMNPAINGRFGWARVVVQERAFLPTRIDLMADPQLGAIRGKTENVTQLILEPAAMVGGLIKTIELDGQKLTWGKPGEASLVRIGGNWRFGTAPGRFVKNEVRGGGFKDVFRNRFVIVLGTGGTSAEVAWATAKARFDLENLWYRGNGAVDILRENEVKPADLKDRNVVFLGKATSPAWRQLIEDAGGEFGGLAVPTGPGLGWVSIRPRPDSAVASIGFVGGSDLAGMRLTDRLPFFTAGAALPDVFVVDSRLLADDPAGIRVSGFFGWDWSVKNGEFVTR